MTKNERNKKNTQVYAHESFNLRVRNLGIAYKAGKHVLCTETDGPRYIDTRYRAPSFLMETSIL